MAGAAADAVQLAVAAATREDGSLDDERYNAVFADEYRRLLAERQLKLCHDARAAYRAMDGWQRVDNPEHWQEMVEKADEEIENGLFLIERLGGERHLDPELVAALLALRRQLLDDHAPATAADMMLIDTALLSYYHVLRINQWVGNLAAMIESEFFGNVGLQAAFKESNGHQLGRVKGLRITERVERVGEQLMPLMDRSHRMMLRSLNALQARKQHPASSVSVGQVGQLNVAHQQVNTTGARGEV